MKDAKGHGSDSRGVSDPDALIARLRAGVRPDLSGVTKAHPWVVKSGPAHQSGVNKIGRAAKIGAYIYGAQAAAGAATGVGWALWHTFGP